MSAGFTVLLPKTWMKIRKGGIEFGYLVLWWCHLRTQRRFLEEGTV